MRNRASRSGILEGQYSFWASLPIYVAFMGAVPLSSTAGSDAQQPQSAPSVMVGDTATGAPAEVITGLDVPWSVAFVGDEALVSQRNTQEIVAFRSGRARSIGVVPNVTQRMDGGLLGIATLETGANVWIYAFHSTRSDNRIVRMRYANGALGRPQVIVAGLPGGRGHNGGRIAFGPDGMLYAATGEAQTPSNSQDMKSLGGKILRMTPDGAVPGDNPFPGSPIYSLGHRNPQGLTWDNEGQLWATEFGDKQWDELNRIEAGKNYGWPEVEGRAGNPRFVDPIVQWRTPEMGPSGLTYIDGTFFIAGLTGQRLWSVRFDAEGKPVTRFYYAGRFGRIRDVLRGHDGSLWFVTNNTDGRRGPLRSGDDRILAIAPSSL